MTLDIVTFSELVLKAKELEEEDKIRNEWNSILPHMISGFIEYVSFEDYMDRRTGRNIDMRPTEVILAEIHAKHAALRKEEDDGNL